MEPESTIKYFGEAYFEVGTMEHKGHLFHRRDYHEDGSTTDYYGVELSKDHFKAFRDALVRWFPGITP